MELFADRSHAGGELASKVRELALDNPVVLGLPRGGVPVGFEVATVLGAPLDVFVARKIGLPGHEELGVAAIAEGGDDAVLGAAARNLGIGQDELDRHVERERAEVHRRVVSYRGERALPELTDRDVVLVDDGLATGVTAQAALRALRTKSPRRLVLAVPVGATDTAEALGDFAEVVCVSSQDALLSIGMWYEDFTQTDDTEVLTLLDRANGETSSRP